jgi:Ca2+-binding RTX toxin-like protein
LEGGSGNYTLEGGSGNYTLVELTGTTFLCCIQNNSF